MPPPRKQKEIPTHLESLPALPDYDADPDGHLEAYFYRIGAAGSGRNHMSAKDNPTAAWELCKRILNFDHEPTIGELEALAEGKEAKPLSSAMEREIEIRHNRHEAHMADLGQKFSETKNPLFAWDAYQICKKRGKPLPLWVVEYFDTVARKLLVPDLEPTALQTVLGFTDKKKMGGGPQAWEQYYQHVIRVEAVAVVIEILREMPKTTIEAACEKAFDILQKKFPADRGDGVRPRYSAKAIEDWYKGTPFKVS